MILEYDDLKRDLTTAISMLEDDLTDGEHWELYARIIVLREYEDALLQLRDLAASRGATEVVEFLADVSRRAGLAGDGT